MSLQHSPSVVTNGLVLCMDAANPRSYPASGTTWRDISGTGYVGTLTNGPTYSSSNLGGIVFDGVDDCVDLNSNSIISGTNPFTIECFFTLSSGSYGELFGNYGSGYSSGVWFATAGLYINGSCYVPNYASATQGTHCLTSTRDGSGNCVTYLDGVQVATAVLTGSIPSNINFRMGSDVNVISESLNGKIYSLKVYNTVLTATQVLQNFNALRGRYGI